MSNINKQALREAAEKAISEEGETWWNEEQLASDYGLALHKADANFIASANPSTLLALLDELEAADALNKHLELAIRKAEGCSEALRRKAEAAESRVDELEAREVKLPDYTEIYQDEFAKEVEHQVRVALNSAGISIKGGRDMAEFTKQFMKDIISGNGFGVAPSAVVEMARQLLSSMEQEPVGITDKSEIEGLKRGEMANVMPPDFKGIDAGDEVLLYAAPQLPQPAVVPSNELLSAIEEVLRISDRDHEAWHRARKGIADFRAAMLQGAEPVQGWIPCSERMPVENDIVLVVDDGYFVCEAQYREGDFFSAARGKGEFFETTCRDVELWMPLPAAPQQEVK